MGRMSDLHAEMIEQQEDQYEPSEAEMRAAAIHHTMSALTDELWGMPPEAADLDALYKLEDAVIRAIHRAQKARHV